MLRGSTPLPGQSLAAGGASLDALRTSATRDPKGAIKEAAKQFEALFMQELMKSMRSTTLKSGLFDDQTTEMAGGMLDQQYAMQMSGQPGGLADAIARQLERQLGLPAGGSEGPGSSSGGVGSGGTGAALRASGSTRSSAARAAAALPPAQAAGAVPTGATGATSARALPASVSSAASAGTEGPAIDRAQDFLRSHRAAAEAASASSGIPADFMLAQAAHETGWGRREIRNADGSSANNFFGIKAGGDWKGPVATATTTEVIGGVAHKVTARFRAYATPAESFADYARLVGNSPRYADVVEAGGDAQAFAQGLQRAGYATDPAYADKLGRVINTTLRLAKLAT